MTENPFDELNRDLDEISELIRDLRDDVESVMNMLRAKMLDEYGKA